MTVTTLGCRKETDQDKVKKVITGIQKAAEEKDAKKIIKSLSTTYSDPQGFNFETMKGLLLGYFFQHPKISVSMTDLEISVADTFSKAVFQAVLPGLAARLLPDIFLNETVQFPEKPFEPSPNS